MLAAFWYLSLHNCKACQMCPAWIHRSIDNWVCSYCIIKKNVEICSEHNFSEYVFFLRLVYSNVLDTSSNCVAELSSSTLANSSSLLFSQQLPPLMIGWDSVVRLSMSHCACFLFTEQVVLLLCSFKDIYLLRDVKEKYQNLTILFLSANRFEYY